MKVSDPGHCYLLNNLDVYDLDPYNAHEQELTFVKREGPGYPGNVGHHPGTNIQEVLRALIDRLRYVNNQIHDNRNLVIIELLQQSIYLLEVRAAARHNRKINFDMEGIELLPTCPKCGHVGHICEGE